jgi:hypothetical protein
VIEQARQQELKKETSESDAGRDAASANPLRYIATTN